LHGPAEQAVGLLNRLEGNDWSQIPGLLYRGRDGHLIQNPANDWNEKYLGKVRWDNIFIAQKDGIIPLNTDFRAGFNRQFL